jgi:hypothetical protein
MELKYEPTDHNFRNPNFFNMKLRKREIEEKLFWESTKNIVIPTEHVDMLRRNTGDHLNESFL